MKYELFRPLQYVGNFVAKIIYYLLELDLRIEKWFENTLRLTSRI